MKYSHKWIIFSLISVLIISIYFGVFVGANYKKILIEDLDDSLTYSLESLSLQLDLFLEEKKQRVEDFSSDGFIKNSLYNLKYNQTEVLRNELSNHLINNKIVIDKTIYVVSVLDTNGIVVASTKKDFLLNNLSNDSLFIYGKNKTYIKDIFYDNRFMIYGISISAPVYRAGEFVGVVIIRINGEVLDFTLTNIEFRNPVNTYLVDRSFTMISILGHSEKYERGVFVQDIHTENSLRCFEEGSENKIIDNFLDFKGDEVSGKSGRIKNANLCILSELDKNKLFNERFNKFIINFSLFSLYLIIIFTIILIFFKKTV